MTKGIKAKDIRDFEKAVQKLNEVVNRIVEYQPTARLYVTPYSFNLMSELNDAIREEDVVADCFVENMDCGDW